MKMPYELSCHEELLAIPTLGNIVRVRNGIHRGLIDNRIQKYRAYLERSPYGDLADLIKLYAEAGEHIPEPMVWCVAESLAICGVAMQKGRTDPNLEEDMPRWEEIVHR